ncbi:cytochrome P450 [Thozetella sp. PMI_491]|nr:cytochrome P450 [Thozetella sp. PMI_491]
MFSHALYDLEGYSSTRLLLLALKLEEFHAKYGPVVRVGPKEVSIGNWKHLRSIYTNAKGAVKGHGFYTAATFVGKHNIFEMIDPAQHAARRKLSSPPYAMQSVAKLRPLIKEKAEAMVERLITGASASPAGTVNAYQLCGLYSFEVICKAAFAKDFNEETPNDSALKLLDAMDGSAPTLIFNSVMPFLRPLGLGPKLPGAIGVAYRKNDYWVQKSYEMVDHFLKHSTGDDKYLLTPLAKDKDSNLGRKLSHEELVEEAMNYMFAGTGTTSSTLTYLLYELSRPENVGIQSRLRTEIGSLPADDTIAVRNNQYTNAVIKETFRLHPTIISTIPRVLTEPMHIDKYTLPASTVVGMQNWIHHRDPTVFPEPDRFEPDRWLRANDAMELSLTPFSLGKRNCIGQNLAWEEIYWAVSAVMRAGLKLKLGQEMQDWEMEKEDRFNIAPRGRRLMLEVTRIAT